MAQEINNEEAGETGTHSTIEEGVEERETAVTDDKKKDKDAQEPTKQFFKRTSVRVGLALVSIAIVVVIILIPTVFLKNEYKGPQYRDTGFEGLVGYDPSCETSCSGPIYGSHVKLSANGKRMFITSRLDEGIVEVWDHVDDQWVKKAQFLPQVSSNGSTRKLYEDGHVIYVLDLDINDEGTRLVISTKQVHETMTSALSERVVRVYEDGSGGEGFEWQQVGETLDSFALNLKKENETVEAKDWGQTVAMSSDGNIIVVSAPRTTYDNPDYPQFESQYRVGLIQAYQHVSAIERSSVTNSNETWTPFGQTLFGYLSNHRLGEKMALSGDGHRLVVSEGIFDQPDEHKVLKSYSMVDKSWEDNFLELHASDASLESNVVAISKDGLLLAIAEANDSPSAYSSKPYRGSVSIYKWDQEQNWFWEKPIDTLVGQDAFQHFGTSIAFADDDAYTLVVGSKNSYEERFPDGDRIGVFRMNGEEKWEQVGPSFGWQVDGGWNSVAISADGTRVVAGAKLHRSENVYGMGAVRVFDFAEE